MISSFFNKGISAFKCMPVLQNYPIFADLLKANNVIMLVNVGRKNSTLNINKTRKRKRFAPFASGILEGCATVQRCNYYSCSWQLQNLFACSTVGCGEPVAYCKHALLSDCLFCFTSQHAHPKTKHTHTNSLQR